jgi:hypothetical protein
MSKVKKFVIIRQRISSRGGGVEIDLTNQGYKGQAMTAYQNYLGGGLLGAISNDCTIRDWQEDPKLENIALELRKWFHAQTNPEGEWESAEYEQVQLRPKSAY